MILISKELQTLIYDNAININVDERQYDTFNSNRNYQANYNLKPTKSLIYTYFKRRFASCIIMVVVVMLLLTTSLFTDMGLNIGAMLMKAFKSFVGI